MERRRAVASLGFVLALSACAGPPPQSASAPGTTAAVAAAKPADESLTIDFVVGTATLSPTAMTQLDGAARLYREAGPEVMIVSGHSDKTGPEFPNLLLSAKRAVSVKRALVDRGVPADRLQIIALGAAEPTPTVAATRSVVVTWR